MERSRSRMAKNRDLKSLSMFPNWSVLSIPKYPHKLLRQPFCFGHLSPLVGVGSLEGIEANNPRLIGWIKQHKRSSD